MISRELENILIAILQQHDASRIGIFGSHVRGEAKPGSDLDVLVDFKKTPSLLSLVRIQRELSEALGIKVDLLTEGAICPLLIDRIKAELRIIYQ